MKLSLLFNAIVLYFALNSILNPSFTSLGIL